MSENNDKESGFTEPSGSFAKWFDNFWYHYKAQTIIAAVAVVTVVICTVQLLTKESYDYHTMYAGPQILAVQDLKYIERAIATAGVDLNGDGKVNAAVNDVVLLSDEEIAAAKEEGAVFDAAFIEKTRNEFYQQMLAGDAIIMMLSPSLYDSVRESNAFVPLTEMLGELPDSAYDDCGVTLSKTDFGKSFNGIDDLPPDTVLCVRKVTSIQRLTGAKKAEELHNDYVELFRGIMSYKSQNS